MNSKWNANSNSKERTKACNNTLLKTLKQILQDMSNNKPSFASGILASLLESNKAVYEDNKEMPKDEKMLAVKVIQLLNNFVKDRLGLRQTKMQQ